MKTMQPMSYLRLYRGPLILLVLCTVLPLLARGPFLYLLTLAQLCGIYVIISLGLTLLMGYTGQVSLGHAGFYGLGAYVAAIAVSVFNLPVWWAVLLALAAGALLAFISGFMILRLRGHYLALATLCIGVILYEVIRQSSLTGGTGELYGLPTLNFFKLTPESPLSKVYVIWGAVVLVVLWAAHLTESPVGRALRAVHGDEDAAESLGVNAFSFKLKIFIASGVLAALAGVLYALLYTPSYLGPEEFGLMFSVTLVTMVVVGGMHSIWGGVAGAVTMMGLRELITLIGEKIGVTDIAKYEQLTFGLILMLVIIFCRGGLTAGFRRGADRLAGARRQ